MSGKKIIDGLRDAISYAKGDASGARVTHYDPSEMVERVARAIWLSNHGGNPLPDDDGWRHWIPDARVAIAAMREPTEAMLSAGDSMMPQIAPGAYDPLTIARLGGTQGRRRQMNHQFQIGKSYACRSLSDYNLVYSFTVLDRTAKTLTVKVRGNIVKRRIAIYTGDTLEHFKPFGTYSMCPVVYAGVRSMELAEMDRLANVGRKG